MLFFCANEPEELSPSGKSNNHPIIWLHANVTFAGSAGVNCGAAFQENLVREVFLLATGYVDWSRDKLASLRPFSEPKKVFS